MVETNIIRLDSKIDEKIKFTDTQIRRLELMVKEGVKSEITKKTESIVKEIKPEIRDIEPKINLDQLKPPPSVIHANSSMVQPKASTNLVSGHASIRGALIGELKELFKSRRKE